MNGKIVGLVLILSAAVAGGGIWYAQEYGFYDEIAPGSPAAAVQIQTDAGARDLQMADFKGIDADSSPIRWRACFRIEGDFPDAIPFEGATPLIGPRWFDCFDAEQIGADLESGAARAVLSQSEIHPDVDRVLAIYPDGRAYGWHQYNDKTPERGVMD
ncbi:DUF6446 family protein [Paracoccus alkanivorans]|uniref:Histidine kinase n=1 Tax=Paracoccus alkanivorans TaxID=2116655 RepID=A0A3M0MAE6_9RHOB|nr:DUF6446 family protein [Paracoccus alkanivorans]RMC34265.1 histidine kinase [Paracoccus alkanivorans]